MASLEFRLRKTNQTKNCLSEEIKHNDLMSEKYKKRFKYLNHVKHLLILVSTVTGCTSISAFSSLVCVPVGITSPAVGIKICESLQELKSISQLQRRRRKSTIEECCYKKIS